MVEAAINAALGAVRQLVGYARHSGSQGMRRADTTAAINTISDPLFDSVLVRGKSQGQIQTLVRHSYGRVWHVRNNGQFL